MVGVVLFATSATVIAAKSLSSFVDESRGVRILPDEGLLPSSPVVVMPDGSDSGVTANVFEFSFPPVSAPVSSTIRLGGALDYLPGNPSSAVPSYLPVLNQEMRSESILHQEGPPGIQWSAQLIPVTPPEPMRAHAP